MNSGLRPLLAAAAAGCALLRGAAGLSVVEGRGAALLSEAPTSIAIFAQVANASIWPDMARCVGSVAKSAARGRGGKAYTVDLHVAMTKKDWDLEKRVHRLAGIQKTYVSVVENRGADIGEFMQQLQWVHEYPGSFNYDLILKIHSKSSRGDWRYRMLSSLCGDIDQVDQTLDMFNTKPNLGIVGPYRLIWSWNTPSEEVFRGLGEFGFRVGEMEAKMQRTWDVIYPSEKDKGTFPARDRYLISGGSMFWVRPGPLFSDEFQAAIPKFLKMWTDGYIPECETEPCQHMYALERVIPTIYRARYMMDYAQAPKFPEDTMRRPAPSSPLLQGHQ